MIQSFADKDTRDVYLSGANRKWANIARAAARRLQAIDFAASQEDLMSPLGNRLEKLKGDREGQWSVRINEQFRICFRWDGADAWDVEIVDHH